ncbi:MAG: tRNA (adenosine(37)-N6)-dimethylallyltransferase MiaA [Betaproteobacteria bacterium]|nr:tRNA (adenosine(37)-N6)-dimethylallyltransferase MiaA [Betaproteobacteria bacterium]
MLKPIALVGPTASGKTAAAMAIAQRIPLEIISIDSALVYCGMDIGTAKPSAQERQQVAHHLIDIREPTQTYNAANFVNDAEQLIADIQSRSKLPLLVGGTMLYLKALQDGIDDLPKTDAATREAIETSAKANGWPAMHEELRKIDPATASRLAPNDAQRISRALEVWHISGKSLTAWFEEGAQKRLDAHQSFTSRNKLDVISLEPNDRSWLHQRIEQRFDAMLAAGFLDEMQTLRERGDLNPDLPSMRCVGYRQAWEQLDAMQLQATSSQQMLARLKETAVAATRQLAKRQLTWLRSMPERHIIACDSTDPTAQALTLVQRFTAEGL